MRGLFFAAVGDGSCGGGLASESAEARPEPASICANASSSSFWLSHVSNSASLLRSSERNSSPPPWQTAEGGAGLACAHEGEQEWGRVR